MSDQSKVGALGAASAPLDDALLLQLWRSVQGPNAGLTGPLIRFAGLVRAQPVACTNPPAGWTCSRKVGHDGPCAASPQAASAPLDQLREMVVEFQKGTKCRGRGKEERAHVAGCQGTLAVMLEEIDKLRALPSAPSPREEEEPFSEGFWAGRMSDQGKVTAIERESAYQAYRAGERWNSADGNRVPLQDRVALPSAPPSLKRKDTDENRAYWAHVEQTAADVRANQPAWQASAPPSPQEQTSLVAGVYMDRSIADFQRSCEVHIAEEQRKPNPDNALIALLCDSVRCSRELSSLATKADIPAPPVRAALEEE